MEVFRSDECFEVCYTDMDMPNEMGLFWEFYYLMDNLEL